MSNQNCTTYCVYRIVCFTTDMLKIHSKECEWNGIKYPSKNKAAKAIGINVSSLRERLDNGYTCDADMDGIKNRRCIWNGIEYPTYTAAAKANGIEMRTMRWRIKQGYTCDDDVKLEFAHNRKK